MFNCKFVILGILSLLFAVKCEVYTAITDMEHLLNFEGNLIRHLSIYIIKKELKLFHMNSVLHEHGINNFGIIKNITKPVDKFLFNKRMSADWPNIQNDVTDNKIELDFFGKFKKLQQNRRYPDDADLNGAAIALARLQHTYRLNTTDLANGIIKNVQYNVNTSPNDCHIIAIETMEQKKYYAVSVSWFQEALNRLKPSTDTSIKIQILRDLATAHKNQRDYSLAIKAIDEILALDPNNEYAVISKAWLEESMESGKQSTTEFERQQREAIEKEMATHANPIQHTNPLAYEDYEKILYEAVCRGDIKSTPKENAPLRCRYQSNKSAFLKLAPLKLEEISLEPVVILYHGVMPDKEISVIQGMAKKILERAEVSNNKKASEFVDYRISKLAWFDDESHKYVADVSRRVQDMTGFTMETSESLQVVNYGLGGFYATHFDHTPEDDKIYGYGNRIATVMFYMSDVTEGGATAFPFLKKAVFPEKGSAIFWLNLHTNGTGNLLTKHAGCPVLVGSKWVSNKWIHLEGQERTRPCGLHPQHTAGF